MEEDRLTRLEAAISSIDARLKLLEMQHPREASAQTDLPPFMARPKETIPPEPDLSALTWTPHQSPVQKSMLNTPVREVSSGVWLAAAGVLFFVLAASFFVKLAIESGWLTPSRQLCGAAMFGLALIGAGVRLKRRDAPYASFLPATGIVVLFLSVYAGHLHWMLYTQPTAALLAGSVSLLSLFLFRLFEFDFFLLAAVCGSYLIPIVLGQPGAGIFDAGLYFILWDALYATCAIFMGRRLLIGLTAFLAVGVWYLLFQSDLHHVHNWTAPMLFQTIQFVLLIGAVGLYSIRRRTELSLTEAWALFPVLMLFYVVQYSTLERYAPGAAPWFSLAFSGCLAGIYYLTRNRLNKAFLASEPVVATFIALVFFHAVYLELLPEILCPWLGLALTPVLAWLPQTRFKFEKFWPVYFFVIGIIAIEYFDALLQVRQPAGGHYLLLNLLFFGILATRYIFKDEPGSEDQWILLCALVQLLVGLRNLAGLLTSGPEQLYLTSGVWAVSGVLMLLIASAWKDSFLARCSVGVLGLVALKVLFVDIATAGSLARVLTLVIIGALLYFAGLLWRQFSGWVKS